MGHALNALAGVRSLCFLDQQLSCGTGYGRVSFYDLRAAAWMDLDPEPDAPPPRGAGARRPRGYQQLGPGWLCQTDSVYMCAPLPAPGEFACATLACGRVGCCFQQEPTMSFGPAWWTSAPSFHCTCSGVRTQAPALAAGMLLGTGSAAGEQKLPLMTSCISQFGCALHISCPALWWCKAQARGCANKRMPYERAPGLQGALHGPGGVQRLLRARVGSHMHQAAVRRRAARIWPTRLLHGALGVALDLRHALMLRSASAVHHAA